MVKEKFDWVKLLHQIIAFCNNEELDPLRNTSFYLPKESELVDWIETSKSIILEKVVPETFWAGPLKTKPNKISRLFFSPDNVSESIFLLILWSSWSHECCQSIVNCLMHAAKVLKNHHSDWIISLSSCIPLQLEYYCYTLPAVLKSKSEGSLFLEAVCLRQVVTTTSSMYQLFDDVDILEETVELFSHMLPPCKLIPKVFLEPAERLHIKKEGKESFTIVPMTNWYKKSHIVPQLHQMLLLKPIKNLVKQIDKKGSQEDITISVYTTALEVYSKNALRHLGISTEERCPVKLVAFAMAACEFLQPTGETPSSKEKDMLLLGVFVKVLHHSSCNRNPTMELKRIIEKEYLFPMDFIAQYINNKFYLEDKDWCCFLKLSDSLEKEKNEDGFSTSTETTQLVNNTSSRPYPDSMEKTEIVFKDRSTQNHKQVTFSTETLEKKSSDPNKSLMKRKHVAYMLAKRNAKMAKKY